MASYSPPLSLVIVGTIFIGLGLIGSLAVGLDILYRRGWRSMMVIMCVKIAYLCVPEVNDSSLNVRIPVYVLNALYLAPITLWAYFNYGRPEAPQKPEPTSQDSHQSVSPIQ